MKAALIRGPLVSPSGSLNNEPTPPLGLAYIAASLKQAGMDVQGIDAMAEDLNRVVAIPNTRLQYNGIGIDEIVERLDVDARVIGVSCMFSHEWTYYRSLISALKRRSPDAMIIAGGEHCTAMPEYTLRDCPELDYIGLGEGEETMQEFCRLVAEGETSDLWTASPSSTAVTMWPPSRERGFESLKTSRGRIGIRSQWSHTWPTISASDRVTGGICLGWPHGAALSSAPSVPTP